MRIYSNLNEIKQNQIKNKSNKVNENFEIFILTHINCIYLFIFFMNVAGVKAVE